MKVTFSPRALAALSEIHAYNAEDSPRAAGEVVAFIESLCLKLGDYPRIGRPTDLKDVRVVPVVRYPYLVFYIILGASDEIRILRIRHGARKPLDPNDI